VIVFIRVHLWFQPLSHAAIPGAAMARPRHCSAEDLMGAGIRARTISILACLFPVSAVGARSRIS